MLDRLIGLFRHDLAIDLGDINAAAVGYLEIRSLFTAIFLVSVIFILLVGYNWK